MSAQARIDRSLALPTELMPWARVLRAYLAETKFECIHMLRTVAFAVPFLILPLVIYLLFGVVLAKEQIAKTPGTAVLLFSGFGVFAISGPALFGIGCSIAAERDVGLMKLKRALPVPAGAYILAKLLMSIFFGALSVLPLILVALFVAHVPVPPLRIGLMWLVLMVGSLPFCAIGLFIGTHVSAAAAPAITNLIYLPMIWLSGMFIPLPTFLRPWALIWPAFHVNQLALSVSGVGEFIFLPPQVCTAVLVGFTVLFGGLAIRRLARKG